MFLTLQAYDSKSLDSETHARYASSIMAWPQGCSESSRFGPYEADVRGRELRKHGLRIQLQEKSFQLLAILLERPGVLVTREELRQRLWPAGISVEFDNGLNRDFHFGFSRTV
jgi:DNA-binding response OmpR family regulator